MCRLSQACYPALVFSLFMGKVGKDTRQRGSCQPHRTFLKRGAYEGAGAGARIPISSGVDQHHGMFRFSWVMIDPQKRQIILEGMDFVELAADGRLQRITGFFGTFPDTGELARTPGVARRVILL